MIRSMTAFSRAEASTEIGVLSWEIRSVNHRFSEVSLRLPEELRPVEAVYRERIAQLVKRGKIDANLRFQSAQAADQPLEFDREFAGKLAHLSREIDQLLYNPSPISAFEIMRWPGVIRSTEKSTDRLLAESLTLLDRALDDMLACRLREGEKLQTVIAGRCDSIAGQVERVRASLPAILQGQQERLLSRVRELKADIDPGRIEQEVVLLLSKADVAEELDRITAHVSEVRRLLTQEEPVGRRLDFLLQELNREANTLGSKSVHLDTTGIAIELKVLIEQIREQIQNIE